MTEIIAFAQNTALFIISFVLVLGLVVTIHELGHFQVARWLNVKCDAFSIGFGKAIWRWHDKKGTVWQICRWPLGGYVKFAGDANVSSSPSDSDLARWEDKAARRQLQSEGLFHFQPIWRRSLIVAAGPLANFVLAIGIFAVFYLTVGERLPPARVDQVVAGSPAQQAGFQPADIILAANGRPVHSFEDVRLIVMLRAGTPIDFTILRGQSNIKLSATPIRKEVEDGLSGKRKIGVLGLESHPTADDLKLVRYDLLGALKRGSEQTASIIATAGTYFSRVFAGKEDGTEISGPVAIAVTPGKLAASVANLQPANASLWSRLADIGAALALFSAVLSVSIGLTNLLPIPVLDGGRLVLYALEAVRGRPLSGSAEGVFFRLGLVAILLLAVFATWNDLNRFGIFNHLQVLNAS